MNTHTFRRAVVVLAAVFWLGGGVWAFVAPRSFFDTLATFRPYNRHLLHDIGAFQIGIGATLVAALVWRDPIRVVLSGVAVGSILHVVAHLLDHNLGGRGTDVPGLALFALLVTAGALVRDERVTAEMRS
jgi:hypothetical protein